VRRLLFGALLLLAALAAPRQASAQDFPERPANSYVVDDAGVIDPADQQAITQTSKKLLQDVGGPIVVATITSLKDMRAGNLTIDQYAQKMFDDWRIGRSNRNIGILLVVSKGDHKARIELGKDWAHKYDADSHQIMANTLVPAFRIGNYSQGIREGVEELAKMTRQADAETPNQAAATQPPPSSSPMGDSEPSSSPFPTDPDESMGPGPGLGILMVPGGICCCGLPVLVIILAGIFKSVGRSSRRGSGFVNSTSYQDPNYGPPVDPTPWVAGAVINDIVQDSQPTYDNTPSYDPGPSTSFDSGSSGFDSGSSGGFDSGSSGGGGDTGSW